MKNCSFINPPTYAPGGDEVVGGPVAGADVGGLVCDEVLVVVDPGEGDGRLARTEGRHSEQPHPAHTQKTLVLKGQFYN